MLLHPLRTETRRPGMTLIEILVVIAIIAVLIGLLTVGIIALRGKGVDAKNRYDLQQISVALDKFHVKHQCYPPSKIRLCANQSLYNMNDPTGVDQLSLQWIKKIWPNIDFTKPIAWGGNVTAMPATGGFLLEGDQCLVFFLGGIPTLDPATGQLGLLGFSTDEANPAAPGGQRIKHFEFETARLYLRIANNPFPSYNDHYGIAHSRKQPYVYFSSGKRQDGYDPTPIPGLNVSPYLQQTPSLTTVKKFHQSNTYQLISAGADGLFGPGGTVGNSFVAWTPQTANATPGPGKDDMTNFHDRFMGVP